MDFPGRFADKVVVVTGSAQGLGESVAARVAREGGAVVMIDRSDLVHEVSAQLNADGLDTTSLTADLEQYAQCGEVMHGAHGWKRRIDILINNVGGTIWAKPYANYEPDQIEAEIRRSLFPTMWCCHAVLPYMLSQGQGTIVNVSSVATRGVNRVPYAAAKGGVNALTACLAVEYTGSGIRIAATAPGGIEAPTRRVARGPAAQTKAEMQWYQAVVDQTNDSSLMHRYGTLAEQTAPILFLASDEASYITGTRLPVAGGDLG